jgi:hypothetical protein
VQVLSNRLANAVDFSTPESPVGISPRHDPLPRR